MKTEYLLNNIESNEPNNYGDLSIEINYDKDGNTESLSIDNFVFGVHDRRNANDSIGLIDAHIDGGVNLSGVGVFEGMPFKINVFDQLNTRYTIFNGYIDISRAKILCNEITAPAKEQGKLDWLNDVVDSFDYEYLYSIGFFDKSYFIPVPYCINKKQNTFELIITIVSIFVMTHALKAQINTIKREFTNAGNPFQSVAAVINLILEILYCIILLIALIQLLFELFIYLVQPVKYHNGMRIVDLVRIGLSYLGLSLSSSILEQFPYNKVVIIPEKYNLKDNNTGRLKNIIGDLLGTNNEKMGYYRGTFGDLFRALKIEFNAKFLIDNNTVYFEKQDFQLTSPQYTLPAIVDTGYTFNHEELKANRILSFTPDFNDRNTIQEYAGTAYQVVHSPISVQNINMVLLKDVQKTTIPFALGRRKTSLNFIEEVMNIFFQTIGQLIDDVIAIVNLIIQAVNSIIRALNRLIRLLRSVGINLGGGIGSIPSIQSPNLQNLIENRIDMLKMESDYISVPKMVMVDDHANKRNNKLMPGNEQYLNAKYLYDNYHYFNNFVTTNGWNNQAVIRNFNNIPFTFTDYEKVRTNSSILTSDGSAGVLLSLKFNTNKQTATGTYKVRQVYTNNLKITTIYPNE